MDFSFTSDQEDLREPRAPRSSSDATTLERTKQVARRRATASTATCGPRSPTPASSASRLPESVGGGGLGFLETCIVLEEVGRAAAPVPALAGDGPGRRRRSPSSARPTRSTASPPATASSPPRSSSRSATRTHRRPTATGGKLTGEKVCVPAALDAQAFVVSAIDGVYLVDPSPPGVTVEREDTMLGAADGAPRARATPRRPSSPVPRGWRGCWSGRRPR